MSLPADPSDADRLSGDHDLQHLYDDAENPSEVTIFSPGSERFPTEWITVDRTTAVSLSDAR
jgi:hypothetical protein